MDALISAARLFGTAGALVRDRWLTADSDAVPWSLDQLSTAWLTRALQAAAPGVRVRSFERLDQHSGTTTRARIALDYETGGLGATPPRTMFVKIAPSAPAQRLFVTLFGLGRREVEFYRQVRPELPVRAPDVYAATSSGEGRRFALLLEDLDPTEVRFTVVGERAGLDDARRLLAELARLHAPFWESPRFADGLAWVQSFENRRSGMPWERFVTGQMVRRAVRLFASQLPPEFVRVAALCTERRDQLERLWAEGARTLVHGDCHIGNLFFEGDRIGFLDWQVVSRAPGMRDVSYFLCSSLPSALRRDHERDLVDLYVERLAAEGVALDADRAWEQHRLFAVYAWLAAAFTAAAGGGLQKAEIGLAGLRRATRAVVDLESVACVEQRLEAGQS